MICFQHYYDKEAILNRADMLERSGILVSGSDERFYVESYYIYINPVLTYQLCSDHGGHVQDSKGAVGRAAQVHVACQGQISHLPVLPQAGQALRGQQVGR